MESKRRAHGVKRVVGLDSGRFGDNNMPMDSASGTAVMVN